MHLFKGFWEKVPTPIIGLSPMDGVTDAAFRHIACKYSNPSVVFTEFLNVEGLARGAISMLKEFIYDETQRPIVAQIYGVELDSFYKVALMACALGFDGIDINMGCPANKVARRGSGAGMIKIPEHARKVIQTVKKACEDWANGITLEEADIRPKVIHALECMQTKATKRYKLPVSVKTRIGYDEIATEWWIRTLLEEEPANISLHGRTFKQMYTGQADWEEIGKAARLCKEAGITLLGNGDVQSFSDANQKIQAYGVDGVLVGRATFGNPWFFGTHEPTKEERFSVAIEHSKYFEKFAMDHAFFAMRKHLAWYCRGFDGAKEIRTQLMQANSSRDVEAILLQTPPSPCKLSE